jgi:hypothetical protein
MELAEELWHDGHMNWSPIDYPSTLLIECENAIIVREMQEIIAEQMRSPPENDSHVCQLEMGQGKTSVIVPIVAAFLASDERKLVRIVVDKPQAAIMRRILLDKLGGSLNLMITDLPFDRCQQPTITVATAWLNTLQKALKTRSILLMQPEHILSLKLMAIEAKITATDAAPILLGIQDFFNEHSRDIIDESDAIFDPKLELVYPMGVPRPLPFPERSYIIQEVLRLTAKLAPQVKHHLPEAIEVTNHGTGYFPRINILRNEAADHLLGLIAECVVNKGLAGLSSANLAQPLKSAIEGYITKPQPYDHDITSVEKSLFWTDATKETIYLLRGLFADGILRSVLSTKRYRVNFGVSTRTPPTLLSVPFLHKDTPSPRTEFSHPDVLILLTCLNYYYSGLSTDQLFDTFAQLAKHDQLDREYQDWVLTSRPSLKTVF